MLICIFYFSYAWLILTQAEWNTKVIVEHEYVSLRSGFSIEKVTGWLNKQALETKLKDNNKQVK